MANRNRWAGMKWYVVDGHWEESPNDLRTGYIVNVHANDWQALHAEEQPCDEQIFFSCDPGTTMADIRNNKVIDEFVVTAIRRTKSPMETHAEFVRNVAKYLLKATKAGQHA